MLDDKGQRRTPILHTKHGIFSSGERNSSIDRIFADAAMEIDQQQHQILYNGIAVATPSSISKKVARDKSYRNDMSKSFNNSKTHTPVVFE